MPKVIDKILINCATLMAFFRIIKGYFKGIYALMEASETLAYEIHEHNWQNTDEAGSLLKLQEDNCKSVDTACAKFVKALDKFYTAQSDWNEQARQFIDKKLAEKQS